MKGKIKIDVKNKNYFHTSSVVSPCIMAKGDSAASSHYWRQEDEMCLTDVEHFAGPSVLLPNRESIMANQRGQIALSPELSSRAQTAMISCS